jgi:crotonobetainyl-CoA:carnitine CoA-transferase CaiB-like acyl-CoA transferase
MSEICAGLTVVEMGSGSPAAAIAGMILADAGARVIKIEVPGGDAMRRRNPSGFLVWNRGKESLVADLHTADGQQTLRDLAAAADVVIDGFAPDRTSGWGIGGSTLMAANPALVHCDITAFGQDGPYAAIKGRDSLVAAKAGLWARGAFGHRDGPIMYPVPWGSFGAGLQAVAGILAALMVRDDTGRGQQVGATLWAGLEPLDYFVAAVVQLMKKRGEKPSGDARSALSASRYGVLAVTKDGRFIQTSTLLPHQGWALSKVAGIADALTEPRFANLPSFPTAEVAQEFEDMLLEAFRQHDLDYWLPKLLDNADIAFELAGTCEEGLDHPQIVHNGDSITIQDPRVGPVRQVGPLAHFAASPMALTRSAPALDEHAELPTEPPRPSGSDPLPEHPLSGLTIVEFGSFYAMPYGVAMAAALGARVVKLEDGKGDPHRLSFGPEVATVKTTPGKESVSVDLRTPQGREIAHRLLAKADIFVNGYRAGVAERLGLGWDELHELNPRLVCVHAAGYGSDGPYAHRALYAQAAQAVAGSFGRQVGYWSAPERNLDLSVMEMQAIVLPRLGQVVDGDSNAALAVFTAILLAAYHQHRTGGGQFVRTSMIAGNAWAYADDFCAYAGKPPAEITDDDYWGVSALDRLYPAADDTYACVAVQGDAEFRRFVTVLGAPEVADDERFATDDARCKYDTELESTVGSLLLARPARDWEQLCTTADVGCVEVAMGGQAVTTSFDPGLREAGLTVVFEHPLFGEMVRAAVPVTFSATPGRIGLPSRRGENNRSVLGELGYSDAELDELESAGVLVPPDPVPSRT